MDFRFTDEQAMIRDTAAAFLAEVSTSAAVRAAMVTETGYDPQLWQRLCQDMFWQAMHIPEQYGGLGLGYVELVATLEQMGRHLFCGPFHSTVCLAANTLLLAANDEQKTQWLGRIAEGDSASLAFHSGGRDWSAHAVGATLTEDGSGFRLNGECHYVPDGHSAAFLCVAARVPGSVGPDGISLLVLPGDTQGLSRHWTPTMDQTRPQARLVFDNCPVPAAAVLGEPGAAGPVLTRVLDLATIAICADQVGGSQQALDSSVAYTQERVQFGRAVASFQAVKHKAADMMLRVEAARSAVYYAACVADEVFAGTADDQRLAEAASIAKSYCSDAYFFNAGSGIQLHGGVGITAEYDIQLFFKRAKSTETFLGDGPWHRERLAKQLLDEEVLP